jgi:anthranilate synthase component 2
MQKILLIDNFDSFTYNLVQQIQEIRKCDLTVIRNDVKKMWSRDQFDKLVISPGPKTPKDAGISNSLIRKFYKSKPILGVCLGMQCINEIFGGKTVHSPLPLHGKISKITHNGKDIFKNVPQNIEVARYHSLIVDNISSKLSVIAQTPDDIPMAIKHVDYPVYGVQFHPESFMTEQGLIIMKNFLDI